VAGIVSHVRRVTAFLRAHPLLTKLLQFALVALTLGFCVWAVRDQWSKAGPRLEDASPVYLALAFATVAVYYLVFIFGWIRILAAWGIAVPYRIALGAEMVSMLAKYIPGAVWTPAARAVALRRSAGVMETPTVLASVFVEAALSAISGVIVFVVSLAWVNGVDAPLLPLVAFGHCLRARNPPAHLSPAREQAGSGRSEPSRSTRCRSRRRSVSCSSTAGRG